MKHGRLWGIGIGLCVGAGLLTWRLASPLTAWGLDEGFFVQKCTLASFHGRYVFTGDGYDSSGKFFASSGLEVYNGDGTMTGIYSLSTEGTIARNLAYTGTYAVKSNCTSTLTITEVKSGLVFHYDQFIGPTGNELSWMQTDPGTTSAGFERRVR
jgi:hypothetical protein